MGMKGLRIPRPTLAGYVAIGEWLKANPNIVSSQYPASFVKAISDHVGFEVTEASVRHTMEALQIEGYHGRSTANAKDDAAMVELSKRVARIERILSEIAPAHMMNTGGLFKHV